MPTDTYRIQQIVTKSAEFEKSAEQLATLTQDLEGVESALANLEKAITGLKSVLGLATGSAQFSKGPNLLTDKQRLVAVTRAKYANARRRGPGGGDAA